VIFRCGGQPKRGAEVATKLIDLYASHDISPELFAISPGLGTVTARFQPDPAMASLEPLQDAILAVADSVTVLAAPPRLKKDIDVWGRLPETVSVMRALKAEFDPNNVINPGRFVDGI
jgi:glycolate oxidase FAD binding subunit